MIEFIKLNVSYLSESSLLNAHKFNWSQTVNREKGQIFYPIRGKYSNLDITTNGEYKPLSNQLTLF